MSFDEKTMSLAQIYLSMLETNKTPQELAEAKCKAGKSEAIEITTSNKSDVSKSGKKCEDDEEDEGEYDDEGKTDNGSMKVKTKTSKMSEALKGNQHKLDKNKNGKLDGHDFKLLRKEETELSEETSSGNAQHGLSSDSEKKDHADYMKKTHGVSTKYHGKDELSYHGPKANVKKAVLNHYSNDSTEAKALHPHVFKESVELDEDKLGSWVVHKDGKMLKRFSTHTGAKAHAEKHGAEVASSEFYQDKVQKKTNEEVELDEGFVDDIKQSFAKGMADKVKKAIPAQYHKHYDFDSIKSVNDTKEIVKKAKNAGHMKESVELDELSKATLGAYVKDASADRSSKNFELGYEAGAGRQPTQRAHDQEGNRRKGIRRAVTKLTKEEALDELSKSTLGSYVKKANAQQTVSGQGMQAHHGTYGDGDKKQFAKHQAVMSKRAIGLGKAVYRPVDKLTKEEVELDELSKSTLGSYVKKASSDMANKGAAIAKKQADADEVDRYTNRHMSGQSDARDSMRKAVGASQDDINKVRSGAIKRTKNISKAVDRLTKESMEWNWDALLEASEEELDIFIEQLSDEEFQSFAEEFELVDQQIELEEAMVNTKVVKASNTKIKTGFEGESDVELAPRAPAEIDWVAKHIESDYQIDVTATPYKTKQECGVKSQAPTRPGDNRKGESKMKTLKDFRK